MPIFKELIFWCESRDNKYINEITLFTYKDYEDDNITWIENNFGSRKRGKDILARGGQGRSLWEGIWTKISKIKNVAAINICRKLSKKRGIKTANAKASIDILM